MTERSHTIFEEPLAYLPLFAETPSDPPPDNPSDPPPDNPSDPPPDNPSDPPPDEPEDPDN